MNDDTNGHNKPGKLRRQMTDKQRKRIIARREAIAHHYKRGVNSVRELGKLAGCGRSTAHKDLNAIIAQWAKDATQDISERKATIGTRLALLQQQCWEEWERSKDQARAKVVKKRRADGTEEETRTVERGLGDPRYLQLIRDCLTQEALMYNVMPKDQQDTTARHLIDGMVTAALLKLTERHGLAGEEIQQEINEAKPEDQKLLNSMVIDAESIAREADKAQGNGAPKDEKDNGQA